MVAKYEKIVQMIFKISEVDLEARLMARGYRWEAHAGRERNMEGSSVKNDPKWINLEKTMREYERLMDQLVPRIKEDMVWWLAYVAWYRCQKLFKHGKTAFIS